MGGAAIWREIKYKKKKPKGYLAGRVVRVVEYYTVHGLE